MELYDIICVDDEPTTTALFEFVIQQKYKHWRAAGFTDSQDLYDQINQKRVVAHVYIIDLMMQPKNGIEIAKAVRASGQAKAVLIAYTALDPLSLSRKPEYSNELHLFDRVIDKQEGFMKILAGLEASALRKIRQ